MCGRDSIEVGMYLACGAVEAPSSACNVSLAGRIALRRICGAAHMQRAEILNTAKTCRRRLERLGRRNCGGARQERARVEGLGGAAACAKGQQHMAGKNEDLMDTTSWRQAGRATAQRMCWQV
eukprot:594064-Pleurochrysis_carterae.AAC.1